MKTNKELIDGLRELDRRQTDRADGILMLEAADRIKEYEKILDRIEKCTVKNCARLIREVAVSAEFGKGEEV